MRACTAGKCAKRRETASKKEEVSRIDSGESLEKEIERYSGVEAKEECAAVTLIAVGTECTAQHSLTS